MSEPIARAVFRPTLCAYKRQTPREPVEEIGEPVRVGLDKRSSRVFVKADQYGCWLQLYCRIVTFLFAYLMTAPRLWYTSR
jgi:hypothetical protein